MKKFLLMMFALLVVGGAKVYAEPIITKTPIILTGGKFAECFTPGIYGIQMKEWRSFIAYQDEEGLSFDENSTMVFDMAETCTNGNVRITFTFSDGTTQQCWWCLGIGNNPDDATNYWYHEFDKSTYYLKKGLGDSFESKKSLKITKVTVDNFNPQVDEVSVFATYKIKGGTICGQPMTIKQNDGVDWGKAQVFGGYSGSFSATNALTNVFQMKNYEVGDYQKIVIKFEETVSGTGRWHINHNAGFYELTGKKEYEISLDGTAISDFTIFNMDANPDPIKISEVYFYKEVNDIEATAIYEAPAGTTDLNDLTGTNTSWSVTYPKTLDQATVFCGDGHGDPAVEDTHVTITDNDYICFEVTGIEGAGQQLRVWIWDGEAGGEGSTKTLYAYPIADYATAAWTTPYTISSAGTYAVKVKEYNYLKGVKTDWGGSANSVTISAAYVCSGDAPTAYIPSGKYVLSGAGTPNTSATTALADGNAIYYDATGVTGTGVDLAPTNPNAIFKANSGVLANTKNVMIGTTIANLDLTDGYPFATPAGATATAATYTRAMTNQFGTICLPYAVSSSETTKYYTLGALSGDVLTLTAVDNLAAGTPAIVEKVSGSSITAAGAGALAGVQAPGAGALQLYGTFDAKTILASDYEGKSIYAIANNQFVQATNSINLPAFRAFFVSTPASANIRFGFDEGEDATAINALTGEGDVTIESIYSADGAQQSSLQKGMNVVKLSNGEVKKIFVK